MENDLSVNINFTPPFSYSLKQIEVLKCVEQFPVSYVVGQRGEGKTFICIDAAIRACLKNSSYKVLVVNGTYNQSVRVKETALEWLKVCSGIVDVKYKESINSIEFSNQSSITFIYATSRAKELNVDMLIIDDYFSTPSPIFEAIKNGLNGFSVLPGGCRKVVVNWSI